MGMAPLVLDAGDRVEVVIPDRYPWHGVVVRADRALALVRPDAGQFPADDSPDRWVVVRYCFPAPADRTPRGDEPMGLFPTINPGDRVFVKFPGTPEWTGVVVEMDSPFSTDPNALLRPDPGFEHVRFVDGRSNTADRWIPLRYCFPITANRST